MSNDRYGERPAEVTIVIGILGGMAVYGLLIAARFAGINLPLGYRPALLAAILQATMSLGGTFQTLVTLLVFALAIASAVVGYSAWEAFQGPKRNILSIAHKGAIAWTTTVGLMAFAPWFYTKLAPVVAVAPGSSTVAGDLLTDFMGLGAGILGGLIDTINAVAIASLQNEFYIWFGAAALIALYATVQLRNNGTVREWFGAPAPEPRPGPIYVPVEPAAVDPTMMPSVAAPIAYLVRVQRGQLKQQYPITSAPNARQIVIGRDTRNVQIPLTDDTVSRVHASLDVQKNRVYIADLSSAWGTMVNDRRITQRQLLYHNDRVKLGDAEFVFIQGQQ